MPPDAISYANLPNQRIIPLDPDARPLIRITAAAPQDLDHAAIDARWQRLRSRNPRYFDGPILAFHSLDIVRDPAPITLIHATRSGYKLLAVTNPNSSQADERDFGPPVHTGITQLSLTAVITAADAQGRPHVLLGKRGPSTRIYGDMWELGPSGGIEPPQDRSTVATLEERELLQQLNAEITQELDAQLQRPIHIHDLACLAHDAIANSIDLVYRVNVLPPIDDATIAAHNWEYSAAKWTPIDHLAKLDTTLPLIPPTRALLRYLRWL